MYFISLPDHKKPGFDATSHFNQFKRNNIIFNALATKTYCEKLEGFLSIKSISSDEEWYEVGHRQLALRPGQFLILNDGQDYSCRMDKPGQARIQSVFFTKTFASGVFRDALTSEEILLDNPEEEGSPLLEFYQTLYDTDPVLGQRLSSLISALDTYGYNADLAEEHLMFLLHHLIRLHKKEAERVSKVSALKQSTRKEIYRRLCVAREFLHSTFMDQNDLATTGHTACLSSPQLVRQFKAVFHTTPHQYLTQIRLTHAADMLKKTHAPVHEITWRCGFENTSAFCRVFKAQYGIPPLQFRSAKIAD